MHCVMQIDNTVCSLRLWIWQVKRLNPEIIIFLIDEIVMTIGSFNTHTHTIQMQYLQCFSKTTSPGNKII